VIALDKPLVKVPCSANVLFAIPRSKNSKLVTPVGDGDNFEKAIYDLLQGQNYLSDDRLIIRGHWAKLFVPYGQTGYTHIKIWEAPLDNYKDLET